MVEKTNRTYFSKNYLFFLLSEMNKYPLSYILYMIPAISLILLVTTLMNFIYFINEGFIDSQNTQILINEFTSYILLVGFYIILYYLLDSIAAHFSFTQFKHKTNIKKTLLNFYKSYPQFLLHKVIQLMFISLPIILGVLLITFISMIFETLFSINNISLAGAIIYLILLLFILFGSLIMGGYFSLKYTYLPVSIHFSKKKNFLKLSEYHHSIKGHFKSIILRVIILIGIVLIFKLIEIFYDYLTSFIQTQTLVLASQVIGVFISMFLFYFINTYLFYSYKEEFSSKNNN